MPRFRVCNIEVSEEQQIKLQEYLPQGLRGKIFKCIVDDLIEELEKDPAKFIAGVLVRTTKLGDFLKKGGRR